jgi:hypothetical protein
LAGYFGDMTSEAAGIETWLWSEMTSEFGIRRSDGRIREIFHRPKAYGRESLEPLRSGEDVRQARYGVSVQKTYE